MSSVDGFILTIESDAEFSGDESGEEEQVVETKLEIKGKKKVKVDGKLVFDKVEKKVEKKAVENGAKKVQEDGLELKSGFLFEEEEEESEEENDPTIQESWDFTQAIKDIKSKEHRSQQVTTTLDDKIQRTLEARAKRIAKAELEKEGKSIKPSEDVSGSCDESGTDSGSEDSDAGSDAGSSGAEEEEEEDNSRQLGANSQIMRKIVQEEKDKPVVTEKKPTVASFVELNLSRPLIRAVQALGFDRPTPIQAKAIPYALAGRDICGSAVTGSGKTAAFVLPVLERLLFRPKRIAATRVLIVTPTRELTQQVLSMLEKLAQYTDIKAAGIVGGLSMSMQAMELRSRPDIVVATPGRLIDHVRNTQSVDLDDVEILILDEADRLLELGFMDEVMELVKFCPKSRQTLLFSATMTTSVNQLAELSLNRPVRVQADPLYDMAARLVQEFVRIRPSRERDREAMLLALCTRSFKSKVIVFFSRKHHAHRMGIIFGLCGLKAAELHGNLTQRQRLEALQRFRDGHVDFLLCTDLASRGLDIKGVEVVINYEMSRDLSTYIHRVGRTARAGRGGRAVTLTGERQRQLTKEVLKRSKQNVKSRTIPDKVIDSMKEQIVDLAEDIEDVLQQERMEKEARLAEMELNKANNVIEHHNEIIARPVKTWFQSAKEKQMVREAAKEQVKKMDAEVSGDSAKERRKNRRGVIREAEKAEREKKPHRLSRKKRRRLEMKQEEERDMKINERAIREEAEEKGEKVDANAIKRIRVPSEIKVVKGAKKAKQKAREQEAKEGTGPITTTLEERELKRSLKESKKKRKRKEEEEAPKERREVKTRVRIGATEMAGFQTELAPGEGLSLLDARAKKKKKGAKTDDALVFKEADLSKGGLRKGGKLGSGKFKSKKRYKRR
mmetsp:Transcript_34663/g.55440  ORF Transcript_34663/g.55440 Transcript_34663/m.55440 type:complete len:899 (+) Transcript_34663:106-2802(+)|eukprot:CAMPEP_0203744714 /NCGR_PEP_ID=MMETSP0098-20131031/691_1 /ASSEMBLY_ACC=CAM_ASM_000208 /TAXON_ID=96639 /ORGANISM=" , Strain NY0313808BC1" /LENGTH=898 /DNA_ID=CAMNT_0050632305 /DNA_START=97 /DNA_END=2793 /DNA_ORIENTATION=-